MAKTLLISVTLLAGAALAVPSFPKSWQAQTVSGIAIFQGGEKKPDGQCPLLYGADPALGDLSLVLV